MSPLKEKAPPGVITIIKEGLVFMKRILLVLPLILCLSACSASKGPVSGTEFALGTVISLKIMDHGDEALLEEAFELVRDIENRMSTRVEGSDIWEINRQAGQNPVAVSPQTLEVIRQGIAYGEFSQGRFDISMGPVVDLWKIGSNDARLPESDEISEALKRVDYQKIQINGNTVGIDAGLSLDLGAIAKGYAADRVAELLVSRGVKSAILDLGGNIKVIGDREDAQPYRIGIRSPFEGRNQYFGIISIRNQSVVSSGDYERYFEEEGRRYHHIFDTSTGYPVETEVAQVTVITEKSMEADALSTSFYTMSVEEGLALADSMDHVLIIYVMRDYRVYYSKGIEEIFELTDSDFTVQTID